MIDSDGSAPGAFDSAWTKWGRAMVHAEALKTDFNLSSVDADRNPGMRVDCEYKPNRRGFLPVITYMELQSPLWGVLLGDIVNNYRSALDHTAWAAMQIGCERSGITLKPGQENRVQFPICDERDDFNKWMDERLFAVSRAHRAAMRRYQPYIRGARIRPLHSLRTLREFSNDDKHREIQLLSFVPTKGQLRVTKAVDCTVRSIQNRKVDAEPLEVGANLGFITARKARKKDPNPHIEVEYLLSARPSMKNRVPVIDWLANAQVYIAQLLLEFSEPPEEALRAVGAFNPTIDWSSLPIRKRPRFARP
jgi:hypothetical protein